VIFSKKVYFFVIFLNIQATL